MTIDARGAVRLFVDDGSLLPLDPERACIDPRDDSIVVRGGRGRYRAAFALRSLPTADCRVY